MKLISWNIVGIKGHSKQCILRNRIFEEQPDILFLLETKCVGEEAYQISRRCWKKSQFMGLDASISVGGLAMLWNSNTIILKNLISSRSTISTDYWVIGSHKNGFLMGRKA
jgi:exonuclease III